MNLPCQETMRGKWFQAGLFFLCMLSFFLPFAFFLLFFLFFGILVLFNSFVFFLSSCFFCASFFFFFFSLFIHSFTLLSSLATVFVLDEAHVQALWREFGVRLQNYYDKFPDHHANTSSGNVLDTPKPG